MLLLLHLPLLYLLSPLIQEVPDAQYLGVTISNDLTWRKHIEEVAKGANRKLGFLRRNLRGAPKRSKVSAYFTMVRSGMEYAAAIWDPFFGVDHDTLEKVQRRAARWVTSQYSNEVNCNNLLQNLEWASLKDRRRQLKLCLFHNIHTKNVNLDFREDFGIDYSRTTRMGSSTDAEGQVTSHKLTFPKARKPPLRKSTIVTTIPLWNKLPGEVTAASTSDTFRSALGSLP